MRVVGEAEVEAVLIDNPEIIWKKTEKKSGIDKSFLINIMKTGNRQLHIS